MEFKVDNLRGGYVSVVQDVLAYGEHVTVRGQGTTELLSASVTLTDPLDALPLHVGRRLNPAIAAVEAAQLISGRSHPDLMCRISQNFRQFMDGGTFHAPYGPRITAQISSVLRRLRDDPFTRQAVITIWDPALDQQEGYHDYPCTLSLQFLIRRGKLDMQVHMRSNDVWRGLAYDAFQFTQLQASIARYLHVPLGVYRHHAASLHLYDSDQDAAMEMIALHRGRDDLGSSPEGPTGLTVQQARDLLNGQRVAVPDSSTEWYAAALAPYFV